MIGDIYGRLKITKELGHINGRLCVECICECGNIKTYKMKYLKSGDTKSCGCLNRDTTAQRNRDSATHKMCNTRFYRIYAGARGRCNSNTCISYKNYKARGIKFLWDSFEEFKNDMYESYLKHVEEFGEIQTTLDRIDNDGNYYKENCRWATYKEQTSNKTDNRYIKYYNKIYSATELARIYNINPSTFIERLNRGWSIKKALNDKLKYNFKQQI